MVNVSQFSDIEIENLKSGGGLTDEIIRSMIDVVKNELTKLTSSDDDISFAKIL